MGELRTGVNYGKDATPFGLDLMRFETDMDTQGIQGVMSSLRAYGDLYVFIRPEQRLNDTGKGSVMDPRPEVYISDVVKYPNMMHVDIRGALPSGYINAFIVPSSYMNDMNKLEMVFSVIARNGFYLPVFNSEGTLIFTPEQYDKIRKAYDGISKYSNNPLTVDTEISNSSLADDISALERSRIAKQKPNGLQQFNLKYGHSLKMN